MFPKGIVEGSVWFSQGSATLGVPQNKLIWRPSQLELGRAFV